MKRGREADVIHRNWMLNVDEIVKFKYKNIEIHEKCFLFLKMCTFVEQLLTSNSKQL